MKKRAISAILAVCLFLITALSVSASTPLSGQKWASKYINYDNVTPSNYASAWILGAGRWTSRTNASLQQNTSATNFITDLIYKTGVSWDGITYSSWNTKTNYYTNMKCYMNSKYINQPDYTTDMINGIATHELGHALGLNDDYNNSDSVMYYSTSGRSTFPTSSDIASINSLYSSNSLNIKSNGLTKNILSKVDNNYSNFVVASASWAKKYNNLNELAKDAELIVIGKVSESLGTTYPKKGDYINYETLSRINIKQVLKGNHSASDIVISQCGGKDDSVQVISDSTTFLTSNTQVVLFLKKGDNNIYYPINENDGIFTYNADGVSTNFSGNLSTKNLAF